MNEQSKNYITSVELATYIVCPEAWRLKLGSAKGDYAQTQHEIKVKELKTEWVKTQELTSQLRFYAKIVYLLVLSIVLVLYLIELKSKL